MTTKIVNIFPLSIALTFACFFNLSAFAASDSPDLSSLPKDDGKQFLQDLTRSISSWNDYSVRIDVQTFKGDKPVKSDCKFFYKKLDKVRIEVIGGGYRNGTVIVKQNGVVRSHGGMLLGGMKMDLDPDSRMLMLPNGLNCMKCDYGELLSPITSKVSQGSSCTVTTNPTHVDGVPASVQVLEVQDSPGTNGNLYARVYVLPGQMVPLRWELFNKNKLFSVADFKNPTINPGLDEHMFHIQ